VFGEENRTFTFAEFVEIISSDNTKCDNPRGLHACTDPHWRPQYMICGLDFWLPQVDFIGDFNLLSQETERLLREVGLWDSYGSAFDDGKGTVAIGGKCSTPSPITRNASQVFGFNQRGPSGASNAFTHTRNSKDKLNEYYTPDLMAKVSSAYKIDFKIYEEVKQKGNHLLAGGELTTVLEYCASV
jgi:hypothetical protein